MTFLNYDVAGKFHMKFWCRLEVVRLKGISFPTRSPQLLAWPADAPEAVTVVTIAPDFHGAHHGYISHLRKFTAYFTAALCFTTPGDGPPSPPRLVHTHEDSECAFARAFARVLAATRAAGGATGSSCHGSPLPSRS